MTLKRSGERGHVSHLSGKALIFLTLSIMLAVGFYHVEELRGFFWNHQCMLDFAKFFFYTYHYDWVFFFSILMMDNTDFWCWTSLCMPGINPTWLWYIRLFYTYVGFSLLILCSGFPPPAPHLRRHIRFWEILICSFLWCFCLGLVLEWWWSHTVSYIFTHFAACFCFCFCLLKEIVESWYAFFLNCLVAFTCLGLWAWFFLFWKVINDWFNFLNIY
jgi:hypothetical protein